MTRRRRGGAGALAAVVVLAAAAAACRRDAPRDEAPRPEPVPQGAREKLVAHDGGVERWSGAGMLAEAERYIDDPAFRRAELEASLVNPKNTYSRQRLESYGLRTSGWDVLPAWNPRSLQVTTETADALRRGERLTVDSGTPPLWDGTRPRSLGEWVALGREVFFRYPLRAEIFMPWALTHPETGERTGVRPDPSGAYLGLVKFVNVDGASAVGITCALCHTSFEDGVVVVGAARRTFDYGALRLAYHADTKSTVSEALAARMRTWGPGRADVTEDDDEDPVAIPDLFGLRHQTFINQAGTIAQAGPTALAIRVETQLLDSNHRRIRPPRELAYALAMFLYTLEPPPPPPAPAELAGPVARGKALFSERCRGCHENDAYGGKPVPARKVGTEPSLADGAARGTGTYRPPALLRVGAAAPYFHQGAVPSLEDVLSPDRLEPTYARGPLGRGAVAGHTYGMDLPKADRAAVVAYLRTL